MKTTYCGVDIGLKSHTVCLLGTSHEIIKRFAIPNDKEGFSKLQKDISRETKICIEPTGVYGINFFIYFNRLGYDIKFCGTVSSRDFRKSMFRGKKHDNLDCVALAKYRIVHENKAFSGEKALQKLNYEKHDIFYSKLSSILTLYKNTTLRHAKVKNIIKQVIDLRFPEAIQIFPYNRGCKTIVNALLHSKKEIMSGKLNLIKQDIIIEKLKNSIGQFEFKKKEFRTLVEEAISLEADLKQIRADLADHLKSRGFDKLFEFCGLNSVNVAILANDIQDISRFYRNNKDGTFNKKRSLSAFKNYLGIAVTSNQSGQKEGAHKLVKSGCKSSKNVLMMLAMTYISMKGNKKYSLDEGHNTLNPPKYVMLYDEYCKKTKKMIAITKIMNKIATDLFFVLKELNDKFISHHQQKQPSPSASLVCPHNYSQAISSCLT